MSEGLKIALTSLATIGIVVLGQIITKFFIEPLYEQRKIIGRVSYSLSFYTNISPTLSKKEDQDKACEVFRDLACQLKEKTLGIPFYNIVKRWGWPERKAVMDASQELIGYSNGVFQSNNEFNQTRGDSLGNIRKERIYKLLKIEEGIV